MYKITFSRVFGVAIGLFAFTIFITLLFGFPLFSAAGFVPRALCGEWSEGLIALHNFSDFFIWGSYLAIPVVLIKFANKRVHELPFPHLFWLFGLFIVACGTTHLIDIILFYEPVYRLSGVVKLFTAAASVGTVFALVKVIPSALELKSPETLQKEINERRKVEEELKHSRDELEERVKERTNELMKINEELQKEISERKKAIEINEAALQEKEILLKEVHHRVKNNLQIISSLISLQGNQVKDKETAYFFEQAKNRIKSIALVHEKLYKSENISKINFEEYLREFIDNIYEAFKSENKNISVKVNVDKIYLSIDIAISLALIVNEIASNSFKYAFPEKNEGEFYVHLKKNSDSKIILTLGDNGIGLSDEKISDRPGTLGLRLVKVLVAQMSGTLEIKNSEGTEYIITFENLD